jgi:hypothetical protein
MRNIPANPFAVTAQPASQLYLLAHLLWQIVSIVQQETSMPILVASVHNVLQVHSVGQEQQHVPNVLLGHSVEQEQQRVPNVLRVHSVE